MEIGRHNGRFFGCFCMRYEDLDKCSGREEAAGGTTTTEENHKSHVMQSQGTSRITKLRDNNFQFVSRSLQSCRPKGFSLQQTRPPRPFPDHSSLSLLV